MTSISPVTNSDTLDEQYVQDAFHTFLQASLAQARAEGLLDVEVLSSAEGDLMIKGVSLPFLAAQRCTTNSPPLR